LTKASTTGARRKGKSEVILLLYRIEGFANWSDAPYSWHLVPEQLRTDPDERALMTVVLVDAGAGIIRALRAVASSLTGREPDRPHQNSGHRS
jgi:hypothetical protein